MTNIAQMGDSALGIILIIFLCIVGVGIAVPLLALTLGLVFRTIGRIFGCAGGIIGDVTCLLLNLAAMPFALGSALVNLVFGRFEKADNAAKKFERRLVGAARRVWSAVVQRPLWIVGIPVPPRRAVKVTPPEEPGKPGRFVGLKFGINRRRVPPVLTGVQEPPLWPQPEVALGQFPGFEVESRLPTGGSGAKLYVCRPDEKARASLAGKPERVVIKSFAIGEGSTLPQIVRESRALDAARSLGLVLTHTLEPHRFWYAMPHFDGQSLGSVVAARHRAAGENGLPAAATAELVSYVADIVETLGTYHRGGLWHKDVKPDNVIVSDGGAHLVDFGLVTPLASSFTLTTHGTEYFRDPEMVRQALKGAKVNEVDGSRFDIYSAGAVLYSAIENTFPAHGALSSFEKPAPEALRWIIRRAMAEYGKRYPNASQMLADLRYVLEAKDMSAVRPAELPSMLGKWSAFAAGSAAGAASGAAGGAGAAGAFGGAAAGAAGAAAGIDAGAQALREALSSFGRTAQETATHTLNRINEKLASKNEKWRQRREARQARKGRSKQAWSPWATAAVASAAIVVCGGAMFNTVRRQSRAEEQPSFVQSMRANSKKPSGIPKGSGRVLVQLGPSAVSADAATTARIKAKMTDWSRLGWQLVDDDPESLATIAALDGAGSEPLKAELERRGFKGIMRLDVEGDRVTAKPVAFTLP